MDVVIAGSSGFLGTLLKERFAADGHTVTALVRRPPRGASESRWDPEAGTLDQGVVAGADVVVNLAGSPTLGNPHSKKWAHELRRSRVTSTRVLAEAIAASERPPVLLAGNGISYYGDHGEEVLTESSGSRGDALLTDVTREWQEATSAATDAGARVVVLRTSPVLDRRSEPLHLLELLFRFGLGGPIGPGTQYFPVISSRDWVDAVAFLAGADEVAGPVNLVLPEVSTNAAFTKALAAQVRRPAFLKVPAAAVRLAASQMANEVLGSVRATPKALLGAGFTFSDETIEDVLAHGLAQRR